MQFEQIINAIFIISAIAFNLLIAGIFVAMRDAQTELVRRLGLLWLSLAIPLAVVFVYYLIVGIELRIIISFGLVFLYMFLEVLFDYILKIEFRSKPILHAPYIILEYGGLISLIAIAFAIKHTWGYVVSVCFWLLLGSLVYYYLGRRKLELTQ